MIKLTWCVPRRNSANFVPSFVSKIRINVPRSPAVASRVPWIFSAKHVTADSCAIISSGVRSVFAKSTICAVPLQYQNKRQRKLKIGIHFMCVCVCVSNFIIIHLPTHDHSCVMDRPILVYYCSDTVHTIPMDLNSFQIHATAVASMWM